jgi:enoyl-CoA hydratase/carnithine racemase
MIDPQAETFRLVRRMAATEPAALKTVDHAVLSGAGKCFGAGYDLKIDWASNLRRQHRAHRMSTQQMLRDAAAYEFVPWDCG